VRGLRGYEQEAEAVQPPRGFEPPHERRNFLHKILIRGARGAIRTFVPGGGVALDVAGSVFQKEAGSRAKFSRRDPSTFTDATTSLAELRRRSAAGDAGAARLLGLTHSQRLAELSGGPRTMAAATGGCCPGFSWVLSNDGRCRNVITQETRAQTPCNGEATGDIPTGTGNGASEFHHAPSHHHPVEATVMPGTRLRCPKRYVLGIDDKCYFGLPRNSKFRKWRPGRKAKFTGGDLNAIARAGKLSELAEDLFKDTNPAKKAVARNYRANWRKPLKK